MRLPEFSVSSTGFLGWRSGRARLSQVTWFDRTGKVKALTGEPRLANRLFPALDGSHLLVEYIDTAALCDRNQPGFTKLPAPAAIWDRQEATLLYTNRLSDGSFQVLRLPLNSPGGPSEILRLKNVDDLDAVSPDGRFLLYFANGKLYSVQVTDGPDRGQPHLAVHTHEYCFRATSLPTAAGLSTRPGAGTRRSTSNGSVLPAFAPRLPRARVFQCGARMGKRSSACVGIK